MCSPATFFWLNLDKSVYKHHMAHKNYEFGIEHGQETNYINDHQFQDFLLE